MSESDNPYSVYTRRESDKPPYPSRFVSLLRDSVLLYSKYLRCDSSSRSVQFQECAPKIDFRLELGATCNSTSAILPSKAGTAYLYHHLRLSREPVTAPTISEVGELRHVVACSCALFSLVDVRRRRPLRNILPSFDLLSSGTMESGMNTRRIRKLSNPR